MSAEDLKLITKSLAKINERLDKVEASGQWGHAGAPHQSHGLSFLPQRPQIKRSASSPSVFRNGTSEEVNVNQSDQQNTYGRGIDETSRFHQSGAPPLPHMVQQPVYMVDTRGQAPVQTDFKARFEAIKASVSKTLLDPEWSLNDSRAGISASDRELVAGTGS